MKKHQNAQLYAQAVLEMARDKNSIASVLADFALFLRLQEMEPTVKEFLELPFFAEKDKVSFIDNVFTGKVTTVFQDFLKYLLAKKHFALLCDIAAAYQQLADREAGQTRALVFTVFPMSSEQLQEAKTVASALAHKEVIMENKVAPDIIAGAILHLEDWDIDASFKGKLDKIRKRLLTLRPTQYAG
jgi:F-type H+-transporting ATPase subunit delta